MDNCQYRLRLLGAAVLEDITGPLTGRAVQRRRIALLALLASAPKQTVSRDKLVGLLWPEADTEQARHLLSDSLYILTKALGKDALPTTGDDVRLNTEVVWCDVIQFRNRLSTDPKAAIDLYHGPFLDGVFLTELSEFERWVELERDRLAREYGSALETLAGQGIRDGDARTASIWWRRRAEHDPYDSRVALAFVRALADAGERAAALTHARVHVTLLREELGIAPPAELIHFMATLQSEPAPTTTERRTATAVVTAAPAFPQTPPIPSRLRVSRAAVLAAATLVIIASLFLLIRRRAVDAAATTRSVLLATVEGGDSTLALAVREALRAELESNPSIRVVSEDAVRETLRLMRLAPTTVPTLRVAADIAQRRGAAIVVTGSVARVGSGVQLVAQVIAAERAQALATFTERPARDDEVLRAVGRIAESIRARVLSVPVDSVPALPAVSTSSLEALRYYVRARQMVGRGEMAAAAELAEAALVHDSLFALAHYLAGDLLWYIDQQQHSNQHMVRAYELSGPLPPRERLIVRARYEQLVRDEPDSALVYWRLLARSYPDEAVAYEGMRWAHRALGNYDEMAAASLHAYRRDASQRDRYLSDQVGAYFTHGDTTAAFKLARTHDRLEWARGIWASHSGNWAEALQLERSPYMRHYLLLAMGRNDEALPLIDQIRRQRNKQDLPRALLLQARADLTVASTRPRVRELLYEAMAWVEHADLSPPTYARYAERCADIAARLGEQQALERIRTFIRTKDNHQNLRSYRYALTTIAAAHAYARGDMAAAAGLASQAAPAMFYGRSVGTVLTLEADARAAAGDSAGAGALYRMIINGNFKDGDGETLAILRRHARARLQAQSQPNALRSKASQ